MGFLDRLADRVADRIEKKISLPPGAVVTDVATQLNQQQGTQGAALPRTEEAFTSTAFPMGIPIPPAPINPTRDDGRALPRRSEFPISWNLPGSGQPHVPWRALRSFADSVDIVRRCIETRKSQLIQLDWDITVDENVIDDLIEQTGDENRFRVRRQALLDLKDDIVRVREFLLRPDRINGLDFNDWLMMALEEHFVLDALAIYPHFDLGGDLHSLEILDGSTIKPLLDHRGATPQPPAPAYQQILYGFPRGEFMQSDASAAEFLSDQLIYRPRYRRSWTPYGYSNTEQALVAGDLYLKRQEWIRSEFTDGVPPEVLIGWIKDATVPSWLDTPEKLRAFETVLNAELAGNTRERHRMKFLPPGFEPHDLQNFAERYKPDYDEYLVKILCAMFDISPAEMGFTPRTGIGGKGFEEGQENTTNRKGIRPLASWVQGILNDVCRNYLEMPAELTFTWLGLEREDEDKRSETRQGEVKTGGRRLNEWRGEMGLPPYDIPEADEPFIVTGKGIVFLRDALTRSQQEAEDPEGDDEPAPSQTPDREMTKFLTFARKRIASGRWRDFSFDAIDKTVGDELNRIGAELDYDILKAATTKAVDPGKAPARRKAGLLLKERDRLGTKYQRRMRPVFRGLIDLRKAVTDFVEARVETKAIDPIDFNLARSSLTAWLRTRAIDEAVDLLLELYSEGYVTGAIAAQRMAGLSTSYVLRNWRAEAEILGTDGGRGLRRMLAEANITIRSIASNRIEVLARALAEGFNSALLPDGTLATRSIRDIARRLFVILDEPQWSQLVADTEVARAMTVASLDEYKANQIPGKRFITASDELVDGVCLDNEAAGAIPLHESFPNGEPPLHPRCRCSVVPALAEELT